MTPAVVGDAQTCLPNPKTYNYLKAPGIFEYPTPGGHISPSKNPYVTQTDFSPLHVRISGTIISHSTRMMLLQQIQGHQTRINLLLPICGVP